jgi:predicted nucleic acid-binding protein
MKLFLDANILFTAAYSPHGASRALFDLAEAGCCTLCMSAFALEEARRNIALKASDKMTAIEQLSGRVTLVPEAGPDTVAWAQKLSLPGKDAPIMAAAVACGAVLLVTGDRIHFGHLFGKPVKGVHVTSPRDALNMVITQCNEQ